MLACVCQPVSSKHLYSSTKTNVRRLNKPPVRVIRITNSVLSKLDTDENRNVLFELTKADNFDTKAKTHSNGIISIKSSNDNYSSCNNNYNNNNNNNIINNNNNNNNNNNVVKKSKCKINRFKSLSSSSSESEQSDNTSYCSTCSKSGFSSSSKEEVVTKEPKRVPLFEENKDERKVRISLSWILKLNTLNI